MAGPIIYIGSLFSALITEISTKFTEQAALINSQLTTLGNINTAIGAQVSEVFLKASATLYQSLTHADLTHTSGGYTWSTAKATIKPVAKGSITLKAYLKTNNASYGAEIGYSFDGGTTVTAFQAVTYSTTYVLVSTNIIIQDGKTLTIHLRGDTSGVSTIQTNSMKVYADIIAPATSPLILL